MSNNPQASKVDRASERIMSLQSIVRKLAHAHRTAELGLFQQYLDADSLYIKQLPRV